MDRPDFPPSKVEVMEQLRAVLAMPRFTNAPKPSAILKLGVERILQGEKTTGKHIAKGVFGKDFDQYVSPDVRVTASNLRKTLKTYYEREGADDLIVFSYPEPQTDKSIRPTEGEAYTPRYAFNPANDTLMLVRLAYSWLEKVTYRDHERAFRLFERLLDKDPQNVEVNLGMATTLISFAQWGWANPLDSEPKSVCEEMFIRVAGKAAGYWRYWATKAYLVQGREDITLARKFYGRALALSRSSVEDFLPFIWHLVETKKEDEAIVLAQRYLKKRFENATVAAQYGMLLVQTGRREMGIAVLEAALEAEPSNCLVHQLMAVVRFYERDVERLAVHINALKSFCDHRSFLPFVTTLENNEEQFDLKGCLARIMS